MTHKQDKPDKWEQASVLSARAKAMVPAFDRYMRNEGNRIENSLAYNSLTGVGYNGNKSGIQGIVRELRAGTVEERAQELLDVLHNQHGTTAEFAANLLVAVATDLGADRLRVEHDIGRFTELAVALRKLSAPKEIDQAKLDVLCELMVRVYATHEIYSPLEPEIKLSPEKTAQLKKMLTDLGISEKDADDVLYESVRYFSGDAKIRLLGIVQPVLDWVIEQVVDNKGAEFTTEMLMEGKDTKEMKKMLVTGNDLARQGSHLSLRPEKEEEIVTEMLLYMLKDPEKTVMDAALHILLSVAKEYAHKFGFYKQNPEPPRAESVAVELPKVEETPDSVGIIEDLQNLMVAKGKQITVALSSIAEDDPKRGFLLGTMEEIKKIAGDAGRRLNLLRPGVSSVTDGFSEQGIKSTLDAAKGAPIAETVEEVIPKAGKNIGDKSK